MSADFGRLLFADVLPWCSALLEDPDPPAQLAYENLLAFVRKARAEVRPYFVKAR